MISNTHPIPKALEPTTQRLSVPKLGIHTLIKEKPLQGPPPILYLNQFLWIFLWVVATPEGLGMFTSDSLLAYLSRFSSSECAESNAISVWRAPLFIQMSHLVGHNRNGRGVRGTLKRAHKWTQVSSFTSFSVATTHISTNRMTREYTKIARRQLT